MSYNSKFNGSEVDAALELAKSAIQEHQDISHLATNESVNEKVTEINQSIDDKLEEYATKEEIITVTDGDGTKYLANDGEYKEVDALPQGGTAGQVLTKTEEGAEWMDSTGGEANLAAVDTDEEELDDVDTLTFVKYTPQTLTDEQKQQAKANLGITENDADYGTVKSITAGAGLTGGTITEEGTIGLEELGASGSFVEPSISREIANSSSDTNLIYDSVSEYRYKYEIDTYGRITGKLWAYASKPTVEFGVATASKKGLMSAEDKVALIGKQDKIQIIDHGTDDTVFELTPNILHKWGTVTSLSLTLATPEDDSVANYYMIEFTSGTTATSLSLPDTITWANDLNIEAGKTYQISILNNLGVIGGF